MLVVGDKQTVAEYVKTFTVNGYCVISAESAAHALRCIEEFPCDVIVLTRSLSIWTRRAIAEVASSHGTAESKVICIGACETPQCCGRGWISEDEPLAILSYLHPKPHQA